MINDFGHQFIFLVKKTKGKYQIFSNLINRTWKKIDMARDTISNFFFNFYLHANINKKRDR